MRAKEKDSVLVNDLKGDMLKNTKDSFEKFGYDVYCLNLVDPTNGIHYNPLDLVKQAYLKGDTTKAQMLANSLSLVCIITQMRKNRCGKKQVFLC